MEDNKRIDMETLIINILAEWDYRARRYRKNIKRYEESKQAFEAEYSAGCEGELRRCSRELRRIMPRTMPERMSVTEAKEKAKVG